MIYFVEHAIEQLLKKFSQSLKSGGYLFVDGTKRIINPEKYGLELAYPFFFYRKKWHIIFRKMEIKL